MTQIQLHNTATRRKEPFAPIDPESVRMYVCGPTVYDRAHLGNARPAVVFDVLYRLLRHEYGADHVTFVRNITDVDDKINARAAETGREIRDITDETIGWYHEDMGALGVLPPTHEPRATDYIAQMIVMIEGLIAKGFAYEAEGHVLFEVANYPEYGALSGRSVDDMIAGARVEVAPYKRHPMDFVLWKPSDAATPGWDSPWGRGRPGWHIECSAMSKALLGEDFDIHGGGIDLQFPHHENEIAQSKCACNGCSFARVWLHNEMLQVDGKKMSKSLGNFFTVRDLLDGVKEFGKVSGSEIRMAFLLSSYRAPMDFSPKRLENARAIINEICENLAKLGSQGVRQLRAGKPLDQIVEHLCQDLDTPAAIAELRLHLANKQGRPLHQSHLDAAVGSLELIGLDLASNDTTRDFARLYDDEPEQHADAQLSKIEIDFAELREKAKAIKDYSSVDAVREKLDQAGVEVRITARGVFLVRKTSFDPAKLQALK